MLIKSDSVVIFGAVYHFFSSTSVLQDRLLAAAAMLNAIMVINSYCTLTGPCRCCQFQSLSRRLSSPSDTVYIQDVRVLPQSCYA
jgi:hypothetical protein